MYNLRLKLKTPQTNSRGQQEAIFGRNHYEISLDNLQNNLATSENDRRQETVVPPSEYAWCVPRVSHMTI